MPERFLAFSSGPVREPPATFPAAPFVPTELARRPGRVAGAGEDGILRRVGRTLAALRAVGAAEPEGAVAHAEYS